MQTLQTDLQNDTPSSATPSHAAIGTVQDDLDAIRKGTLTGTAAVTQVQTDAAAVLTSMGLTSAQVSPDPDRPASPGGGDCGRSESADDDIGKFGEPWIRFSRFLRTWWDCRASRASGWAGCDPWMRTGAWAGGFGAGGGPRGGFMMLALVRAGIELGGPLQRSPEPLSRIETLIRVDSNGFRRRPGRSRASQTIKPGNDEARPQRLSPTLSVLLIEDDVELCELMREFFAARGIRIEAIHDGRRGLAQAFSGAYDLILLDVMLPGLDGFEVLAQVRRRSSVPIIMLTARTEKADRIAGLDAGADDYLPKPFDPEELTARMRAVLRRGRPAGSTMARRPSTSTASSSLRARARSGPTGSRST